MAAWNNTCLPHKRLGLDPHLDPEIFIIHFICIFLDFFHGHDFLLTTNNNHANVGFSVKLAL